MFAACRLQGADETESIKNWPGQYGCDFISLDFAGPAIEGPTNIIFATAKKQGVELFSNCEVWQFNDVHPVELQAKNHRIQPDRFDRRLRIKPNLLDEMRARRVALTQTRWRVRAVELWREGDLSNGWLPDETTAALAPP